jgi:hypothetical protein
MDNMKTQLHSIFTDQQKVLSVEIIGRDAKCQNSTLKSKELDSRYGIIRACVHISSCSKARAKDTVKTKRAVFMHIVTRCKQNLSTKRALELVSYRKAVTANTNTDRQT